MARRTIRRARRVRRASVRRVRRTRRRTIRRRGTVAPRAINLGYLLPDRVRMKCPYICQPFQMGVSFSHYDYVYSGNSIYDCDKVLGSAQNAMMFDQMMALYGAFYVAASKCKANYHAAGSASVLSESGTMAVIPTVFSTDIWTTVGSTAGVLEQKRVRSAQVSNALQKDTTVRNYATTRNMLASPGRTQYVAQGTLTASPQDEWYWHVFLATSDWTTVFAANYVQVKIVYYVEFITRTGQAAS